MKITSPRFLITVSLLMLTKANAVTVMNADFTVWQEYSVGPNFNANTPGWVDYTQSIREAATPTGFATGGTVDTPGYFSTVTGQVPLSQSVSTRSTPLAGYRVFNNWHGQANPGSVFGSAYANEYGNFVYAPMLMVTTGGAVTVNSINREVHTDTVSSGTVSTWSAARVGVSSYGGDGQLGGGDDTYLTTGSMSTTPVLAVIWVGSGYTITIHQQYDGTPWPSNVSNEDIYWKFFDQWDGLEWDFRVDYQVNYTKGGPAQSETIGGEQTQIVPEPSAFGLGSLAAIALLVGSRNRKHPRTQAA